MKKLKKIKKIHIQIVLLTIILMFILAYYMVAIEIKPVMKAICEVKARIIATQAINNAVKAELQKDNIKDQLIVSTFDNAGRINMIKTNAQVMNILSANITASVQEKIKDLTEQPFTISLGAVLNNWMFPDFGPNLHYNIIPQGSVLVDFISEFVESGINQTKYKLYITVSVQIRVISPIITSDIEVKNNVLLTEIVIIGDVPESFTQFPINNR